MKVEIEPLSLRTATWVAHNMRDGDKAEIMCQLHPDARLSEAGLSCYYATGDSWKWEASIDGSPVACFGIAQWTYPVWCGWAYGLTSMKRAVPAITRHFRAQKIRLINAGCRRIEVRAIKGHDAAHLWIKALGGRYLTDLEDCGRDGETFELWQWTYTQQKVRSPSEKTESKDGP